LSLLPFRQPSDAHVLSLAALLIPTLGFLTPLGVAPLLVVVALGLVIAEPRPRQRLCAVPRSLAAVLGLLALWAAISAGWSITPKDSLLEALRFAAVSALGLVAIAAARTLDEAGGIMVGRSALVGLVIGFAIVAVERFNGLPIHSALSSIPDAVYTVTALDRGAVIASLVAWVPIAFLVTRGRIAAAICIFVVTLAVLASLAALGARIGFIIATCAFAAAWWRPRIAATALAVGFAVLTAVFPLITPSRDGFLWLAEQAPWLKLSIFHRLIIWRFAADRIAEHPLLGWGMDTSRSMPGGNTEIHAYMDLPKVFSGLYFSGTVMPLHPHDAILQSWLELGAVGAALGAAVFVWIAVRAATPEPTSPAARSAQIAVLTAAISPLLLSFGVWQPWFQSSLWLIAALALAVGAVPTAPRR
jgi:O-antigen ligase